MRNSRKLDDIADFKTNAGYRNPNDLLIVHTVTTKAAYGHVGKRGEDSMISELFHGITNNNFQRRKYSRVAY